MMTEYSYYNPVCIYEQSKEAVQKLTYSNYQIEGIKKILNTIIEDEKLQGEAYKALKEQMQNYILILDATVMANENDIADFYALSRFTNCETLEGNIIITMMEQALADKASDEMRADICDNAANNAVWFGEEWYYREKARHYRKLVNNDQKRYEQWKSKMDLYDNIEYETSQLFTKSVTYREVVSKAINGIMKVFDAGEYQVEKAVEWKNALKEIQKIDNTVRWLPEVEKELLEYGYTQEEIDELKRNGVVVTVSDIEKLKQTEGNEKIYISADYKALLYAGKIYYINRPDAVHDKVCLEAIWETDYIKEVTKTNFDVLGAITGISGEEIPTNDVYTTDRSRRVWNATDAYGTSNMRIAGGMHLFLLLENTLMTGLTHTEVEVRFESSGNSRRVTILVGRSIDRQKFQNFNYAIAINTFGNQTSFPAKLQASAEAALIYTTLTGIDADKKNHYTLVGTLDERHAESSYTGFLSYSEDGNLQYTPIIYSGDSASVATCDLYGLNVTLLYDFTDKLSQPVQVDSTVQNMFESILSND
ncbi:MAG: hypothetical protein HDR08_09565 [Lachnospiraceae bacterium]|nr:hypothetical protein [Lachnospiraceae bacterium]